MIRRFLIFLLVAFSILSLTKTAAADDGPPIEEVFEFDAFDVEILNNGKYYTGILVSENEYIFYTRLKSEYKLLNEQLNIWKDFGAETKSLLDENIKTSQDVLKNLDLLKKEVIYESWWDRHKFEIGVVSGVVATVVVILAVDAIRNE